MSGSLEISLSATMWKLFLIVVVVQCLSLVQLFVTPWTAAARLPCPSPSPTACSNPCPLMMVMPSNHLILCCFLLLLPSIFPSIKVLFNESALHIRWLKYWSFSFNISPSNEYSGLISFRMDWFDLLAVQGTLKSLPQHHRLKISNLWCLDFCMVQLTFVRDYWTNHSFDSTDLCWQIYVSAV